MMAKEFVVLVTEEGRSKMTKSLNPCHDT